MPDEMDQETQFGSMTKAELQAEARARGVSATGTKAALLRRLQDFSGDGDGDSARGEPDRAAEKDERGRQDGGEAEPRDRGRADDEGGVAPQDEDEGGAEPQDEDEAGAEPQDEDEAGVAPQDEDEAGAEPQDEDEAGVAPQDEDEAGVAPQDEDEPVARGETPSSDGGDPGEPAGAAEGEAPESAGDGGEPAALAGLASTAARALADLTGRTIDAVSGVQETDGGYEVTIEVLELSRVPSTTDVLATYEVEVSRDGDVTGYSRAYRYYRNQISRE